MRVVPLTARTCVRLDVHITIWLDVKYRCGIRCWPANVLLHNPQDNGDNTCEYRGSKWGKLNPLIVIDVNWPPALLIRSIVLKGVPVLIIDTLEVRLIRICISKWMWMCLFENNVHIYTYYRFKSRFILVCALDLGEPHLIRIKELTREKTRREEIYQRKTEIMLPRNKNVGRPNTRIRNFVRKLGSGRK